jgi:FlaA1/EpsC-like NDP-sugar epimerase
VRVLGGTNKMMLFSRDEAKHWTIRNQIGPKQNISYAVGDIRDAARVEEVLLIPNPIDQNPCAHWRNPMDMMRQG